MNSPFKINLSNARSTVVNNTSKKTVPQKPFKKEIPKENPFNENLLSFFRENQTALQELIHEESEETVSGVEMPYTSSVSNNVNSSTAVTQSQRAGEIEALFDMMVNEVHFLNASGDSQTTIFLNGAEFAHSPFYGSQILIEEFSTAPKMFNITFISNPQGASLFQMQAAALTEHFKQKDLPFSIHRLEVELVKEEEPLWLSKEHDNSDKEEQDA